MNDDSPENSNLDDDPWLNLEPKQSEEEPLNLKFASDKHPLISLSLPKFLDILWAYNKTRSQYMSDFAYVELPLGELIAQLDPAERYCHIEYVKHPETILDVAQIWPLVEWRTAYERTLKRQKIREEETAVKSSSLDLLEKILTTLSSIDPWNCMDREELTPLIRSMLRKRVFSKINFMTEGSVTIKEEEKIII